MSSTTKAELPGNLPDPKLLEAVITTSQLRRRPPRAPDYEKENRALVALAQEMASSPKIILQKLVETAMELCRAGSGGVSLVSSDGTSFYWPAVAGSWQPYIGGGTPRNFGPCGIVLDRNATQLFSHPERYYPYLEPVTPPIEEVLLIPFYVGGKAVGTLWVVAHDQSRRFDTEDERILRVLGEFASAAYQGLTSLDALTVQISERKKTEEALRESQGRLGNANKELAARVSDVQKVVAELQAARRAAFNVMEDALTARQEAEQVAAALQVSEERLRMSQQAAHVGAFDWNIETGVNNWTQELEALYGLPPGGFARTQPAWEKMIHPEDRAKAVEAVELTLKTGKTVEAEWRVIWPDGSVRWLAGKFQAFRDSLGKPLRLAGVNIDITERKQAEQASALLAAIVQSSDDAIISKDLTGVITSWNEGAERLFGYSADEAVGQSITMLIPPARLHEEAMILDRLKRGERIEHFETVRVRKDGAALDLSLTISPVKDAAGLIIGASKVARNISERKQAEQALRRSEQETKRARDYAEATLRTSPVPLLVLENDLRVKTANEAFYTTFAVVPEDTEGRLVYELGNGQWNIPKLRELLEDILPKHKLFTHFEVTHDFETIGRRAMLLNGRRMENEAGSPERIVLVIEDITDRKRSEEALRESEERFRMLADNMSQLSWTCDLLGNVTWYNQRWYDYTGTTFEEMKDWGWKKVQHPDHLERVVEGVQHSRETGEVWEDTFPLRSKAGEYRWFLSRAVPIRDSQGKIVRWFGTNTDVTDIRQAEEALRRSEKLAATGQLASTIAHEINNPMQALTNLLALLSYKTSIDSDARNIAEMAQTELSRMAHITKQMLSFHRDTPAPVPVRLTEVLEDALELWAIKLKGQLRVERKYQSTEHIAGFPGELRQVFVNLIGNALEAAHEGEPLRLHVFPSRDWKDSARRGVRVVVADRGSGIKPQHMGKIFEPFFTTKSEKGTGLGLWVSKQAVERHGGHIRVRSSTRRGRSGTVFSIFLPRQAAKLPASMMDSAAVA